MRPTLVLLLLAQCLVEHALGLLPPKYNCYGRPNEKFTNSYDSRCDWYCNAPPPQCPRILTNVEGCYCIDGYYRNSRGVCVEQWQCYDFPRPQPSPPPQPLPPPGQFDACWYLPNEMFTNDWNPKCEPTCDEPNKPCNPMPTFKPGCTCKVGYLRNIQGACVEPWKCYPNPMPTPDWNQWGQGQQSQPQVPWYQSPYGQGTPLEPIVPWLRSKSRPARQPEVENQGEEA